MKSVVHKNLTQFSRKRRGGGRSREANETRTVIYADFCRNPFDARIVCARFMRLAFTKKQTETTFSICTTISLFFVSCCFQIRKQASKKATLIINVAFFDACSFELEIFRFWLSEKRRRRRGASLSIFTTPKRKRSRGAAAERTPVGTSRICSGAALQVLEIGPLCLWACALLRNKYGPFGLFDRSASALRAMRERGGTHTAWYASRR